MAASFLLGTLVIGGLMAGAVLVSLACRLADDLCDRWDRWMSRE